MTLSKVKIDNIVRYIRLRNANNKPENGIEIKSKLFPAIYKNVSRRIIRKGVFVGEKMQFQI